MSTQKITIPADMSDALTAVAAAILKMHNKYPPLTYEEIKKQLDEWSIETDTEID
jgi:5-enolpyruvylshikimate-3-phosphate synthase